VAGGEAARHQPRRCYAFVGAQSTRHRSPGPMCRGRGEELAVRWVWRRFVTLSLNAMDGKLDSVIYLYRRSCTIIESSYEYTAYTSSIRFWSTWLELGCTWSGAECSFTLQPAAILYERKRTEPQTICMKTPREERPGRRKEKSTDYGTPREGNSRVGERECVWACGWVGEGRVQVRTLTLTRAEDATHTVGTSDIA
jgi:hypothetical protein